MFEIIEKRIPELFYITEKHTTYLNDKNRSMANNDESGFVYIFLGVLKSSKKCVLKVGYSLHHPVIKQSGYSRIQSHYYKDFLHIYMIDLFKMNMLKEKEFHEYCSDLFPRFIDKENRRLSRKGRSVIRELYKVEYFKEVYELLKRFSKNEHEKKEDIANRITRKRKFTENWGDENWIENPRKRLRLL